MNSLERVIQKEAKNIGRYFREEYNQLRAEH